MNKNITNQRSGSRLNFNPMLTISTLIIVSFLNGVTDHFIYYLPMVFGLIKVLLAIIAVYAIYQWYCQDAERFSYERSIALNISIVVISVISVPYYIYNSRTKEKTIGALIIYLFSVIVWYVAYYAGFEITLMFRGS